MGKPQNAQAIAKWAEKQSPAHSPAYKRLTDTDRILITRLAAQGIPQTEIAQRLGCDQSSVSRWLNACQDSTKEATAYLRGQSLRMARKVAGSDDGKVLIQALKGVNVLQEQQQQGVTVLVGNGGTVNFGTFASQDSAVTEDLHSVTVDAVSDNTKLC